MTDHRPASAKPKRAIVYVRQSTFREESISLELQESACRQYCQRYGYFIVDVIADPGVSGLKWERRPGIQKVMTRIEAGDADVVVIWRWSRLSRNRLHQAMALDAIERSGALVESATEPFDTATAGGEFGRDVMLASAHFESRQKSEQWRDAHMRRIRAGLPHTGKPRWGYDYAPNTGFTMSPTHGPVLRQLYLRYTNGESSVRLTEWLTNAGFLTTQGKHFDFQTLLRMLDTGFGAGVIRYGDEVGWGIHEPVISRDEWEAYQVRRREARRTPSRTKGSSYLLSGLVRCARCNGPMYAGQFGHARKPKYRCATRSKRGESACVGGYVMAHFVERAVLAWLSERVEAIDAQIDERLVTEPAAQASTKVDLDRVSRRVVQAEEALTRLTIDRAQGLVPDHAYIAARDEIEQRRKQLIEQHDELRRELDRHGQQPNAADFQGLLREWDTLSVDHRRLQLRALIREVRVLAGRPRAVIDIIPAWVG